MITIKQIRAEWERADLDALPYDADYRKHLQIKILLEEVDNLKELITQLRQGTCWCLMGIGFPDVSTHTPLCDAIHAFVSNL